MSILHPPVDDPQSGEMPCERWNPTQNVRLVSSSLSTHLSSLEWFLANVPYFMASLCYCFLDLVNNLLVFYLNRTILLSVISLLNEPNTFSPANVDASVMYRRWKDSRGADKEYENIIRKQV